MLALGCGYPTYQYVDEAAVPDGSTEQPDVEPARDSCVENGCGGCNDKGVKGQRCEPCGQWTCSGTSVVCMPAMPTPGTTCGMCGTQKRTCTALGTTTCPMDDDRLIYEDAAYKSRDAKQWVVSDTSEAAIAFKSVRTISYFDVSVVLRQIPYASTPTSVGSVTVTLYSGSPSTGLAPLATSSVAASSIPTTAAWIAFTFSAPVSPRPVGAPLTIGITSDSTAYAFEVFGGGPGSFPPAATDTVFWHRSTKPMGPWVEEPSNDLAHVLRGKACAP